MHNFSLHHFLKTFSRHLSAALHLNRCSSAYLFLVFISLCQNVQLNLSVHDCSAPISNSVWTTIQFNKLSTCEIHTVAIVTMIIIVSVFTTFAHSWWLYKYYIINDWLLLVRASFSAFCCFLVSLNLFFIEAPFVRRFCSFSIIKNDSSEFSVLDVL